MRGREEGIAEGIARGQADKALSDARNMLAMNLGTPVQISQIVGLPLERIEELAREVRQG